SGAGGSAGSPPERFHATTIAAASVTTTPTIPSRRKRNRGDRAADGVCDEVMAAPATAGPANSCRPGVVRVGGSVLHAGLHHLGVLEVGRDNRADAFEQALELRVLGVGDERLVERIEDDLVVGDLVIDVRLV